ncbi:MAG: alpha/beta fold hydrolase, partial [Acidobacteriota bacterium]
VVVAGPPSGAPVVLLHGFPESSFGWRHQIEPLAAAGFRVVAPDQRGYADSGRPRSIGAYRIDRLAGDVVGLLDALGLSRARLVGHDWGAAVAWWTALAHPERIDRLAILNLPHPGVMRRALRRNPRQMLRSSYILLFQLPGLPEALMRPAKFTPLVRGLTNSSLPGTFTDAELERYRLIWDRPGALTGMLHWYRALRRMPPVPAAGRVLPPTLVLWGARDAFLGVELARPSVEQCDSGRLVLLEDCTHWLQHEAPVRVARELLRHLGDTPDTTT